MPAGINQRSYRYTRENFKKSNMRAPILLLLCLTTTSHAYASTEKMMHDLQLMAAKMILSKSGENYQSILSDNEELFSNILNHSEHRDLFQEGRTYKIVQSEDAEPILERELNHQTPFTPHHILGLIAEPSPISKASAKEDGIECTFRIQCFDRKTELLSITFYDTSSESSESIATFSQSITLPTSVLSGPEKMFTLVIVQMASALTYYANIPLLPHFATRSHISGLIALVTTYFLATPYPCFSGVTLDFYPLLLEYVAISSAIETTYYLNPATIRPSYAMLLWALYLALGTLKNSDYWYRSNESLEDFQSWIREYSPVVVPISTASLGALIAAIQANRYLRYAHIYEQAQQPFEALELAPLSELLRGVLEAFFGQERIH